MAVNIPLNSYFYSTSYENAQLPISISCRFKTSTTAKEFIVGVTLLDSLLLHHLF